MKYASSEARKFASKGANSACVEDKVVYGWAVHYFEEDSIEGTLFNADGTEYKPAPKPTPAQVRKVEPKKPEQRQATLNPKSTMKTATMRTNSLHKKKSTKSLPKLPKKKNPMRNRKSSFHRSGKNTKIFKRNIATVFSCIAWAIFMKFSGMMP